MNLREMHNIAIKLREENVNLLIAIRDTENSCDILTEQNTKQAHVIAKYREALEQIANVPDNYEMEYCRDIAILSLRR